jgi:hypothetical protein
MLFLGRFLRVPSFFFSKHVLFGFSGMPNPECPLYDPFRPRRFV